MKAKILYLSLIIFSFYSCSKNYLKQKEDFTHYSLKESTEDEKTKNAVLSYKLKVDIETEKVIASSTEALLKDEVESTLGNFVCDALHYNGKKEFKDVSLDLVIINRGGLRVNLPKGDIKIINIFELMPFENELVVVKISGEKLLDGLPTIIEKKHAFLGMKIKIEKDKLIAATVNDVAIEKTKNYTILTSDYLASGGDNFIFLKNPLTFQKSNLKIRDALINYCIFLSENKKQIIPYKDGRFQISK